MKIAVVSIHDENYAEMADLTWTQNKKLYCERWGYTQVIKTDGFNSNIPIGFEKIVLIKEIMSRREHQWIYWAGCDTMITNFAIPLDQFAYDDAHFVIATDFNGINADSFMIRNSFEGRSYIDMILRKLPEYSNNNLYEQGVMIDTYQEYKNIIKIVPQKFLNSYVYDLYRVKGARNNLDKLGLSGNWTVGDFLCHCPDHNMDVRMNLFRQLAPLVIK